MAAVEIGLILGSVSKGPGRGKKKNQSVTWWGSRPYPTYNRASGLLCSESSLNILSIVKNIFGHVQHDESRTTAKPSSCPTGALTKS